MFHEQVDSLFFKYHISLKNTPDIYSWNCCHNSAFIRDHCLFKAGVYSQNVSYDCSIAVSLHIMSYHRRIETVYWPGVYFRHAFIRNMILYPSSTIEAGNCFRPGIYSRKYSISVLISQKNAECTLPQVVNISLQLSLTWHWWWPCAHY